MKKTCKRKKCNRPDFRDMFKCVNCSNLIEGEKKSEPDIIGKHHCDDKNCTNHNGKECISGCTPSWMIEDETHNGRSFLFDYQEAPDLKELAAKIIASREEVCHVDIDDCIFIRDMSAITGDALAKCFSLLKEPIQFFTNKKWCIMIYDTKTDYMNENQLKILLWHELMHIPPFGDKLIDHNVKDFMNVLHMGLDWSKHNAEPDDILQ